jgi:uncharacterized protein YuzE
MKVKYFSDTDTALVEFTDNEVVETKEIGENIYLLKFRTPGRGVSR